MDSEKEIKENYPIYPLSLRLPRKLSVRIGSRNFYVDVPYIIYQFMLQQVEKAASGAMVTKRSVRREWKELVQDYKDYLTVNGEPIATVYLMYQPFANSSFLVLRIYWSRLIKYLELKAEETLEDLMNRGSDAAKEFYEGLWLNFFMTGGKVIIPHEAFITSEAEKVRRLLKVTGDYHELNEAINELIIAIDELGRLKKYVRPIEFYIALLTFYVQYLREDIEKFIDRLPKWKGASILLDDNLERIFTVQIRPRKSWHAGGTAIVL